VPAKNADHRPPLGKSVRRHVHRPLPAGLAQGPSLDPGVLSPLSRLWPRRPRSRRCNGIRSALGRAAREARAAGRTFVRESFAAG
jgi:hypothetical protein